MIHSPLITPIISSISKKEISIVSQRLRIDTNKVDNLLVNQVSIIKISSNINSIKKRYTPYVKDTNDTHIVAGAAQAQTKYLITYNIRHYMQDQIKEDFDILLMTPGAFLQYLRNK